MRRLALALLVLLLPLGAWADEEVEPIAPDRASASVSANTVGRAAFFRTDGGTCVPGAWGLRLWNGRGEQMVTVACGMQAAFTINFPESAGTVQENIREIGPVA